MVNKNNKNWKECEKCLKKTRNIRIFKGKFLCFKCYQKESTSLNIGGFPQIFREPLTEQLNLWVSLTKSQKIELDNRLEFLFPMYKNYKSKKGISEYLRALILSDLEMWEASKQIKRFEGENQNETNRNFK